MKRPVNLHQRKRWSLRRRGVVPDHVIQRATVHTVAGASKPGGMGRGNIAPSPAGSPPTAPVTPANSRRYRYGWREVVRAILGVIIVIEIALIIAGVVVY